MKYGVEFDNAKMEKRFSQCAKGVATKVIALLAGYGLTEDDLAAAMDDVPHILKRALTCLQGDIQDYPGDYMTIVAESEYGLTVTLEGFDPLRKIAVIKAVREITGLTLKEAKDMVESAPKPVKENLAEEEAEEIMKKLATVGGQVSCCKAG